MDKTILLATSNAGKLAEFREVLSPLGYTVLSLKEVGIVSNPNENGKSYRENAYIKAKDAASKCSLPVLADDSGIEIQALNNEPGLFTARYAKENGGFPAVFNVVLKRMQGAKDRSAAFHCSLCLLLSSSDEPLYFDGVCPGWILEAPVGHNGFGYDPIFHSLEANADFGTAPEEIKNRFSHRGKAIAKLVEYLSSQR